MTQVGRKSIFRGKSKKKRVQGLMTPPGSKQFEARRKELADLSNAILGTTLKAHQVSDGDTIEYGAYGRENTITYLESLK